MYIYYGPDIDVLTNADKTTLSMKGEIIIKQDEQYVEIAKARIKYASREK